MSKTSTGIGPKDQRRGATFRELEPSQAQEGFLYELGRGKVEVDAPGLGHVRQVASIRKQLMAHELDPRWIDDIEILSGAECKILLDDLESKRHPDLAVYSLTKLRTCTLESLASPDDKDLWSIWFPEVVIEVVSPTSQHRDYVEKREEYLEFGVGEYWIVDGAKHEVLVLRGDRGTWSERVVRPGETYETKLLPGFAFDCRSVFAAAAEA